MKVLKFLFVLALVALSFSQGAPAAYSNSAPDVGFFMTTAVDGVGDTLKTNQDSVTLVSNQYFPRGYDFILDRSAIVASGDSCGGNLRIRSVRNGQVVYFDTVLTEGAEQILLPINRTLYGDYFDIKWLNISTLAATNAVLGKITIWTRRAAPISYEQPKKY